ncbi:MAG: hypothetical protein BGO68_01130 [Candidatus Amoebophilus sp. 36-38]|nr:MAG: hypothetical protein BGO68_01130 [Candidatus Amoebophilus sp. 36-38]
MAFSLGSAFGFFISSSNFRIACAMASAWSLGLDGGVVGLSFPLGGLGRGGGVDFFREGLLEFEFFEFVRLIVNLIDHIP